MPAILNSSHFLPKRNQCSKAPLSYLGARGVGVKGQNTVIVVAVVVAVVVFPQICYDRVCLITSPILHVTHFCSPLAVRYIGVPLYCKMNKKF